MSRFRTNKERQSDIKINGGKIGDKKREKKKDSGMSFSVVCKELLIQDCLISIDKIRQSLSCNML